MTTTGQFLVANSTLPSGTALQHLQALQIGTGNGQTIFASQFLVSVEEPRSEATLRPKKRKSEVPAVRRPIVDARKDNSDLFCVVPENMMFVPVESAEMSVFIRPVRTTTATYFEEKRYAMKSPIPT